MMNNLNIPQSSQSCLGASAPVLTCKHNHISSAAVGPPATTISTGIADTGSTSHFFAVDVPLLNKRINPQPIQVKLPDHRTMESTHIAELPLSDLPKHACVTHIFPALGNTSLISIGQLCDAGCQATFTATQVSVSFNNKIILTGYRNDTTQGLWHMTLPTPQHSLHAVNASAKPADLVTFAHAAMWSPANSTLLKALQKGFLPPFPGLNEKTLRKYPPCSAATIKGHLDTVRKNTKSTKEHTESTLHPILQELLDEAFPPQSQDGERTHFVYAIVHEIRGAVHSDLTGRFPTPSSSGNHYILLVYCYDANAILLQALPNRSAQSILNGYKAIVQRLVTGGCRPKLQRLDNECSAILKQYMQEENIDYQLVPPHNHRRNAAERAIRTAKNHLIAGWSSADPNFPMHLWDQTLPHAELTLNLLRASRLNPKLSAYEQLFGRFDFNRTPIAPPGTKVLAHVKSTQRKTWAPHALDGWYIGPAMESYRCHQVYITSTRKKRIVDTISWLPTKVAYPNATQADLLRASLQDIANTLQQPPTQSLPTLPTSEVQALKDLAETLTNKGNSAQIEKNNSDPITISQPLEIPKQVRFAPGTNFRNKPTAKKHTKHHTHPAHQITATDLRVPATTDTEPASDLRVHIIPNDTQEMRVVPETQPTPSPNTPHLIPPSPSKPKRRRSKRLRKQQSYFAATDTAVLQATKLLDDDNDEFITVQAPKNFSFKATNPDTGLQAEYRELLQSSDGELWEESMCNEIGRLFQGYRDIKGTDTCKFIKRSEMPADRKATYIRIVVADRPKKTEPRRVRLTVGGDKVDYPGEVTTKTTDLVTAKLLINSVISKQGAKFMTMDIKDFFLNNILPRKEYARIPVSSIPQRIMDQYNLHELIHDGFLYMEISKGMYGLPQASRVANDALLPRLAAAGYKPTQKTPGLFRHESNSVMFCLTVDDFGVQFVEEAHAVHLRDLLKNHYKITEDWTGTSYCGLDLDWNYEEGFVDVSMKGYVQKALQRFEHPDPKRPQHAPHKWTAPIFGATRQMAEEEDVSPALTKEQTKRLQEVIGTFLYYARAVDPTMLVALGTLAQAQTRGTTSTMEAVVQLLNYAATHPEATIRYRRSDMILHIHSDASYLSEKQARSRVGGYYFLDGKDDPTNPTRNNGAVHVESRILRPVMSSAAEAETAALFHNAQEGAALRNTLEEMGWPQPGPTPIECDNTVATGLANDTVKAKRTKAMDMRFYWIKDRVKQGQFRIYWKSGKGNKADYFTKHHPPSHHQEMRQVYLQEDPKKEKKKPKASSTESECEGVLIPKHDSADPSAPVHSEPQFAA